MIFYFLQLQMVEVQTEANILKGYQHRKEKIGEGQGDYVQELVHAVVGGGVVELGLVYVQT